VTTDNDKLESAVENGENGTGEEKSFFARGAALGLVGGALVAVLLISAFGSVVSLVDDVFGSSTPAAADEEPVVLDPVAAAGQALSVSTGCTGCHSADGSDNTGPTWQGLSASVDEEYIRTAIVNPNAVIADGYAEGIMPANYADTLAADEIDALVAYIQSL
jgi:mono/diheme cytochrome c family protein